MVLLLSFSVEHLIPTLVLIFPFPGCRLSLWCRTAGSWGSKKRGAVPATESERIREPRQKRRFKRVGMQVNNLFVTGWEWLKVKTLHVQVLTPPRFALFENELCRHNIVDHIEKCNRAASSDDADFKKR